MHALYRVPKSFVQILGRLSGEAIHLEVKSIYFLNSLDHSEDSSFRLLS